MGTVSFDGQFPKMRKPQDFIVYPMQDSGPVISIQSDHRYGKLDLDTGKGVLSENKKQYANAVTLGLSIAKRTATIFTLPAEDLQTLRQWIKSTGGDVVGDGPVTCVNIGALAL